MRFALTQKVLTFGLSLSSAVPLLISGEVGSVIVTLFSLLFFSGWFISPSLAERVVYRRFLTGAVGAMFAIQLGRLGLGMPMAMLGMEFTVFLLGIKLVSRAHASDDNQIVILCFLHIIAATVVMTNIIYGVAFLLFVTLSSPMLALSYLRQEIENRFAPRSGREKNLEMIARLFNSKRIVSLKFLLGSALLTVPILMITAVLFLIFPRIGLGFVGRFSSTQATVGFGKEVVLGDMDIVRLEDTVMMRLLPIGDSASAPPSQLDIKLRGAVFDAFDGRRWKKSVDAKWRELLSDGDTLALSTRPPKSDAMRYEILLETMEPKVLFLPEGVSQIQVAPQVAQNGMIKRPLEANFYGEIRYQDKASVGVKYQVAVDDAALIGAPPISPVTYLSLYSGSRRLEKLATQLAGEGDDWVRAKRLADRLKRSYKYAFALSSDLRNKQEHSPLNRFLFARKTGTCEHFATAYTLMLRAVGIPARLVTGFSGADWNDIGEFYSVRKRYAHSWTEVYLEGRWHTMDATPAASDVSIVLQPSLLSRLTDTLRMRWQAHIIGYNLATQGELALKLWKMGRKYRPFAPLGFPHIRLNMLIWGLLILGLLSTGAWAIWHRLQKRDIRKTEKKALREHQKRAVSLLDMVENRLAKLGYVRPLHKTPTEFLRSLEAEVPFSLTDAFDVVAQYNTVRFGRGCVTVKELKILKTRIRLIGTTPKSL